MSTFDETSFMNAETQEQGATQYTPVPEGEFMAAIKDIKSRSVSGGRFILDVNWSIDDPSVTEATGMEFPTVRQSHWLDLTESGGLDMGKNKNVSLNRLREVLGQNVAGKPWKPGDLVGGIAKVRVQHRISDEIVYTDVKGVAKA